MLSASQQLDIGDIVHIRAIREEPPSRLHRFACEIVDIHEPSPGAQLDDEQLTRVYTLRSVVTGERLPTTYGHNEILPSPRGYDNINTLLGDPETDANQKAEELLAPFKRHDLELINRCLSVVDFDTDPTKDWLNELNKQRRCRPGQLRFCRTHSPIPSPKSVRP